MSGTRPSDDPAGRVVVTAIGLVSPLGDSPAEVYDALCRGAGGLALIAAFPTTAYPAAGAGGEIPGFDAARYLGDGNLRPLDRTGRLAAAAAALALAASGWTPEARAEHEVGLVLGTQFGSVRTIAEFDRRAQTAGPIYAKPLDFANSVINAAAGQTAIWHRLRGVNTTLSGGPTAGLGALGYAADLVAAGSAEAILAGGADELCLESWLGFVRARLLAGSTNGATGPPRPVPFDAARNGFAAAEGAALLVLETEAAARARGVVPRAVVAGHGAASDPSRGRDAAASAAAVERAIRRALAAAGYDPQAIGVVFSGASGSLEGDRREAAGIAAALGERAQTVPVTATKSMLGEALGASAALAAAMLVETLAGGRLPGIAGLEQPEAGLPLGDLVAETRPVRAAAGLLTALDLDGSARALVLARPERGTGR